MERKQSSFVILGILAIHPNQTGYEIRKTIEQSVGFFWGESYGQIYPTLKRLVADGLIVASVSGSNTRAGRQEYSTTPDGELRLQEWIAVPYRDDPPRNEFLLKLFFGNDVAPSVSISHIRRFQEKNRSMLMMLLELERQSSGHGSQFPGFPFWMMTLKFGVSQLNAALEWSEAALKMLTEMEARQDSSLRATEAVPPSGDS